MIIAKRYKKVIQRYVISLIVSSMVFIMPVWSKPIIAETNDLGNKVSQKIESDEVQSFMDGLLAAQMQSYHIPGATVSVVQDGKMIFANGYGYADVDKRIPVSADKTLFRAASVSKLFVWTAVMQLAEQGKLDLNTDLNTYLTKFKIPETYSKPITLSNLMNHTPGFEERAIGESVGSAEDIAPLEEYLKEHMPARVREPGVITAYSNYGASLAGYIVSEVSGMPFEKYVEEYIFKPLYMSNSTFMQPLPQNLASNMAVGYTYKNGSYIANEFEWKQSMPAGALSTTAADMANFMIAHLQNGRLENNRILEENTTKKMHEQSFTNDPRVNGLAHGFMETTINGEHIIWHGGVLFHFHSALVLLPEHNVGFFISYNSANAASAVNDTLRAFMDHYYPENQTAPSKPADPEQDVSRYAGTYMPARHEYTTLGKMVGLFSSITVKKVGEHELQVDLGFPKQLTARYKEIEPSVFRSMDVPPLVYGDIIFRENSKGNIEYQFQENNPTTAYIKLPWYAEPSFTVTLAGICVTLFLFVVLSSPFVLLFRKRLNTAWRFEEKLAYFCKLIISILSITFIIGFIIIFSNQQTVFGLPYYAKALFILPWVIGILAVCMSIFTIIIWKRRHFTTLGRVFYTFVTLGAEVFVWWLVYWNLWILKV